MLIETNELLYSVSLALDAVEQELLGAAGNHSKRAAYVAMSIGKKMGMSNNELLDLAACTVLHDNALTEYITTERRKGNNVIPKEEKDNLEFHCSKGEENAQKFPFRGRVAGVIKYHHENFDGSGYFSLAGEEIPLMSRIIRLADNLDATYFLAKIGDKKNNLIKEHVKNNAGVLYDPQIAEYFLQLFDENMIENLKHENINQVIENFAVKDPMEFSYEQVIEISQIFSKIIDFKSPFTLMHSSGIAEKATKLAEFYGLDDDTRNKLTIAAFLHDIGKLTVPNEYLEKPGPLTKEEFEVVKKHVYYTYEILSKITSFKEIAYWAASHHEKLSGNGYYKGYDSDELDFCARIMACVDIYQALTEDRPYRKGMTHEKAMSILYELSNKQEIDSKIVKDIDTLFAEK